ncbi:cupin domain-containing protein [Streptomyces sp. NBC_01218]|uniref:cupin domain-containing protein n=1 Tax=Streptomyces sp. NBC_01218 TaxID=2903780 RepID=UPI003FA3C598
MDAGEFSPHAPGSHEYVAVEQGCLHLTVDGVTHRLQAGDAACCPGNRRHAFAGDTAEACVHYLAMTPAPGGPAPPPVRRARCMTWGARPVRRRSSQPIT